MSEVKAIGALRILLFMPISQLVYQLAADFVTSEVGMLFASLGLQARGIVVDVLLGLLAVLVGAMVVPASVRRYTAVILVIFYGLNAGATEVMEGFAREVPAREAFWSHVLSVLWPASSLMAILVVVYRYLHPPFSSRRR